MAALGTHRILVPRPGIEPRPSAVKHRALATRPLKKFLAETFLILSSMELSGCSVPGVGSVWTDRDLAEKGNIIIPIIWGLYTSFPLKLHPDPGALEEFLTKWNRTEQGLSAWTVGGLTEILWLHHFSFLKVSACLTHPWISNHRAYCAELMNLRPSGLTAGR